MNKWFNRRRSDQTAIVSRDTVVFSAAALALALTIVVAVRAGTFEAIAEVITTGESSLGCVRTADSGTTDLSGCH